MKTDGLASAKVAVTATAVAGDSGSLYRIVAGLLDDGVSFETVLFDLLAVTEGDIGSRWQQGDYLISEEHAATATIETVVSLLAGSFDRPSSGLRVVIAAAEGDTHSLPGRMVAAYLSSLGHQPTFLGADVHAGDLREYFEVERPDALVLSCAVSHRLLGARAVIRSSHALGVPVVVGGRGFGESGAWGHLLGADAWAATPQEVPGIIESWDPDVARSEAVALDASDDLAALTYQRSAALAKAQTELEGLLSGPPDDRLIAEIALLLSAVEAAMLVDDVHLVSDMLSWQRSTLAAHGYSADGAIAEALRRSLLVLSPPASELLASAG